MALNQFMHPRNRYRNNKPDFAKLAQTYPEFKRHLSTTLMGKVSLDFRDPEALRALTCTLLKEDFGIDLEIPLDRIIPTVPLRLNYILWIEDLLKESRHEGSGEIYGIDVGCGTSCVYPLLGAKLNSWHFTASEVDSVAAGFAKLNVKRNDLHDKIQVLEVSPDDMLCGIFKSAPRTLYHFTMCNPPFFGNMLEAQGIMTSRNPGRRDPSSISTAAEGEMIWEEGGEVDFIKRMIDDSLQLREQVVWYTSMVGKKASLAPLKQELAKHKIRNVTTTEFCQGRTMRWGIGWTFHEDIEPPVHVSPVKKFKRDKDRPPLVIQVPEQFVQNALQLHGVSSGSKVKTGGSDDQKRIRAVAKAVEKLLGTLEIDLKSKSGPKQCSRYILTAIRNTWSNQRRKRRQRLRRCLMSEGSTWTQSEARDTGSNQDMPRGNLKTEETKSPVKNFVGKTPPLSEKQEDSCTVREIGGKMLSKESSVTLGIGTSSSSTTLSQTDRSSPEVTKQLSDKTDSCFHAISKQSGVTNVTQRETVDKLHSCQPMPLSKSDNLNTDLPQKGTNNPKCLVGQLSSSEGSSQETEFIFRCTLTIKVADGKVVMEMSWMEGKTRESMHQVGQYLKNRFNKI